jgi:hypothetical protein
VIQAFIFSETWDIRFLGEALAFLLKVRGPPMDVSRAVFEFVKSDRHLFRLLRSEGESLSKLDLHLLRTQLFILQVEVRSLEVLRLRDKSSQFHGDDEEETGVAKFAPSMSAMAAYLKGGDRLQAMRDQYRARSGAIGRISYFKGMPEKWYVVVE